MQSVRGSGYGFAFLTLGATVFHEACHWLCGVALNARPISVSIWPKRLGRRWTLGTVEFSNINIWNAAFVAFAPLATLPLGWVAFQFWMVPAFSSQAYLSWFLSGYVVACCGLAGFPSTTDIKVGALSAVMYSTLVAAGLIAVCYLRSGPGAFFSYALAAARRLWVALF